MADSAPAAESTALAVTNSSKKRAKLNFCKNPLVLHFGKTVFYPPEDAVISIPKGTNRVENETVLNQIITTKSPPIWHNYLDPDRLIMIKGVEGTSVYTTFKVNSKPDHEEEVFIRHVPPSVCEKEFPKWKEKVAKEIEEGTRAAPTNERQEARIKVLDWKSTDCSRAQINPEHNNWELCKDPPKSLKATSSGAGAKRGRDGAAKKQTKDTTVSGDVAVTTETNAFGFTVKSFQVRVGANYTKPEFADGYLFFSTIAPPSEAPAPAAAAEEQEEEDQ